MVWKVKYFVNGIQNNIDFLVFKNRNQIYWLRVSEILGYFTNEIRNFENRCAIIERYYISHASFNIDLKVANKNRT